MQFETLQELQKRGRFFWEMFPGAKMSDDWQKQRDLLGEPELSESSTLSTITADDPQKGTGKAELN